MKGIYNIMYLKNISIDFSNFDNAYKAFMLLSLGGSKLNDRVYTPSPTHPGMIYPLFSRYTKPGCVSHPPYTLVNSFRPQSYSERKAYKCFVA